MRGSTYNITKNTKKYVTHKIVRDEAHCVIANISERTGILYDKHVEILRKNI